MMRFVVDECTGPKVSAWLKAQGHDVFSVFEDARGLDDEDIIRKAETEDRVIITNDKEFGEKAYWQHRPLSGVVVLRLSDERPVSKIRVLSKLLASHSDRLLRHHTTVTEARVRSTPIQPPEGTE